MSGAGVEHHEVRRRRRPCATCAHVTRHEVLLFGVVVLLVGCRRPETTAAATGPDAGSTPRPRLLSVGPRLLSNQASQPLSIVGEGLRAGMALSLGSPLDRELPLTVLDERHAYARLPSGLSLGEAPEALVDVTVRGLEGKAALRMVNDTTFPELTALVRSGDGKLLFALSGTTDTVFRLELATKQVTALPTADGPAALGVWKDPDGVEWLVVAHQFEPVLLLIKTGDPAVRRAVPGPANAAGLALAGTRAFVAEQARDTVVAVDLATGVEAWRTPVMPNPRELAVAGDALVVGSLATGVLERLDLSSGAMRASLEPGPGTPIVGGGTAPYAAQVMNGKAPRGLAWSAKQKALFVASIGPNVGPNADKHEVSMNGGVGAVDLVKGWRHHLGFGAGVTEALALDDARGLLYATDVGLGLVRVLDARQLAGPTAGVAKALVQEVALRPPAGFPFIRSAADFNVKGRAGPSLHAGPRALVLSPEARRLYVLERFTGTVAVLDVSAKGRATWLEQIPVTSTLAQPTRRTGQVLYFADLGRTSMSCDACHLEGHGEGVLFEKTHPLRIYRSTTVRGSRETPPYFTPASTASMGETAKVVGARNRFHNPDPSDAEIEALALYASLIPTLPNPFVGDDGAPVEELRLPDGKLGHPRRGLPLFEGTAGCAECHPAPQFTLDQDPATRGRFLDVGTPRFMPLREAQQDTRFEGFGTPALVGSWDVFPMLTTGLAGLGVRPDGAVRVETTFPLRAAVEQWAPRHGRADLLSEAERDDLLAYVLSL
jgi:DNA-binding beta-propeller fold protein YncE